jgi:hypothetical protein
MSSPTTTLIQTVSFGVPSGAYDGFSTTWYSAPIYGPGYYGFNTSGLVTVAYYASAFISNVTQAFVGDMNLQATLAQNPQASDWVDIPNTMVGNLNPNNATPIATSVNATGNFTYLRIKVSNFSSGNIIKVQANY